MTTLIAFISSLAALITAVAGFLAVWSRIGNLEVKIDGRLTELLELTAKSSHAEGKLEGNNGC